MGKLFISRKMLVNRPSIQSLVRGCKYPNNSIAEHAFGNFISKFSLRSFNYYFICFKVKNWQYLNIDRILFVDVQILLFKRIFVSWNGFLFLACVPFCAVKSRLYFIKILSYEYFIASGCVHLFKWIAFMKRAGVSIEHVKKEAIYHFTTMLNKWSFCLVKST